MKKIALAAALVATAFLLSGCDMTQCAQLPTPEQQQGCRDRIYDANQKKLEAKAQ